MRSAGYSRRKSLSNTACPVLPSVVVVTQCWYAKIIAYCPNCTHCGELPSEQHCAANANAARPQDTAADCSRETVAGHGANSRTQAGYKEPAVHFEDAER